MRQITRPDCPNPSALKTNYKHPENKKALEEASNGKCMYCEAQVTHVYFGDVEHIKPKATGRFPELKFEWTNLGFCCGHCNNAKKDEYEEDCPIIDPYSEEPNEHLIAFGTFLYAKAGSERGDLTIRTVDLNRIGLLEKRKVRIEAIQNSVNSCFRTADPILRSRLLKSLESEGHSDKEFSVIAASFLAAHI